jgi:hypothetical protein
MREGKGPPTGGRRGASSKQLTAASATLAHPRLRSRCVAPSPVTAPPGASEIRARWRVPLALVPDDPDDPGTEWRGPCPKCGQRGAFTAAPGHTRLVVSCVHCDCDPADVHVFLKRSVPGALRPGKAKRPASAPDLTGDLAALRAAVTDLALNDAFPRSAPIRLALLELVGYETNKALDALGVTDKSNRSRTRSAKTRALVGGKPPRRSPAKVVTNDNPRVVTNDNRYSKESDNGKPSASRNAELTSRATIVSGPTGNAHHTGDTDTDTALAVLTDILGPVEVIAIGPARTPQPVTGPCSRCGSPTTLYGPRGRPVCDNCRASRLTANLPVPRYPADTSVTPCLPEACAST